ncbi:class I SAM-dependent methyltransferase [Phenylobacterium sp.]|uniref:class I SAM-dependent methyltransferase n=1 Tax=Phenylobacterium sp. TaxID=1871053 RepID=UPI002ED7A26A
MGVTSNTARAVRSWVAEWPPEPSIDIVYSLLRLLGQWRSYVLSNTYVSLEGARIWGGPFAGMEYVSVAAEGALMPRLLGTYECELHPHLAAITAEGVDCVIDVGCAEGYYAVGLARAMPQVTVYAHDIEEKARVACADLAARNGVSDRVIVGGEFKPQDFQAFAGRRVLVMVDAEGAEVDILQPELGPALAQMTIIVETHDVYRADALATIRGRFEATHDIVQVDTGTKHLTGPPWLLDFNHLDQLLAVWEWRHRPTPWLVMRPKAR